METIVTVAPVTEPVSLDEAKEYLRVDSAADDVVIDRLIRSARAAVEHYTGRALITQTRRVTWNYEEAQSPLYVPGPPLLTTTTLKTYDAARVSTTLTSGTDYYVVGTDPAIITGANGSGSYLGGVGVRSIEWVGTCGYGAAPAVPDDIKTAILTLVADVYERREALVTITGGVRELLAPYRANLV